MKEEFVEIVEFDPSFIEIFEKYKLRFTQELDVTMELVGSAAVPMLGKKEIDILVMCHDVKDTHDKLRELLGHDIGPITDEVGYARDRTYGIIAEFHVVNKNSRYIQYQRSVVELLQTNTAKREELEAIKRSLDGKPMTSYKEGKNQFMKSLFD